jgi:hypothetical protein
MPQQIDDDYDDQIPCILVNHPHTHFLPRGSFYEYGVWQPKPYNGYLSQEPWKSW